MIRSTGMNVTFRQAVALDGMDCPLPPGTYRVEIEEEPIDGLSFVAYRRLATFIRIPMVGQPGTSQDLLIDPKILDQALEQDAALQVTPA